MSTQYKVLLESWEVYLEKLSKAEKEKRRKKAINPAYVPADELIPVELQRISRGIISDYNECHSGEDGRFTDCKDKGSYSYDGEQGERTGRKYGRSHKACGRKKRTDGHKYRCRDGTLKEGDLEIDVAYLKATINQAVREAVAQALQKVSKTTGCSVATCARMINTLNKSERGKLYDKPKSK